MIEAEQLVCSQINRHDYYRDIVIIVSLYFSSFQPNFHYLQLAKAIK